MKQITFFHCADIHLDSPFSSLAGRTGLPAQRRRELLSAFSRMIETAAKEKPDLLLISGDLFENEYSGRNTAESINALFNMIPETKIIMIAGNHDPEASNSLYVNQDWSDNVHFLGKENSFTFIESLDTAVYGIGWDAGQGNSGIFNSFDIDRQSFNILLFHGDIDLAIGGRDYNSMSVQVLESKGFDYIAAGHNHKKGSYGKTIFNPGSLDPLGFDEPGIHGFFKGIIYENREVSVSFVENSLVEYITMDFDITGCRNDADIISALAPKVKEKNKFFKVLLKGRKSLEFNPDTSAIASVLMPMTGFIKIRDESTLDIPVNELSIMKGLRGEFARRVMDELRDSGEKDREILMKALYYGLEAIDKGKIEKAGDIEL